MGENDDDMRMFSSKTKEGRVHYNVTCVFLFVWNNFGKGCPQKWPINEEMKGAQREFENWNFW
jgi:hypothetical protein